MRTSDGPATVESGRAAGECLSHDHEIRFDARTLEGEPLAAAAETGPDLVGDQKHAMRPAPVLQAGQESVGRSDHAADSLDRLDDQSGGQIIGQLLQARIQCCQAGLGVVHRFHRIGGAGIGQEIDNPVEGAEGSSDPWAMRDRQRAERAAVIASREGEESSPSGRVLRSLERAFDRLRPRVGQLEAAEACGQDGSEPFVQLDPKRRWQARTRMNDAGVEGSDDGGAMCRVTVPQIAGRGAADEVEITLAGRGAEPRPLPGREHRRPVRGAKRVRGGAFPLPSDCEDLVAGAHRPAPH